MTAVPADSVPTTRYWSTWAELLDELTALEPDHWMKVAPRLTRSQIRTLVSSARWRHRSLHRKQGQDCTYVWLAEGRGKGFEKYRGKSNPKVKS